MRNIRKSVQVISNREARIYALSYAHASVTPNTETQEVLQRAKMYENFILNGKAPEAPVLAIVGPKVAHPLNCKS